MCVASINWKDRIYSRCQFFCCCCLFVFGDLPKNRKYMQMCNITVHACKTIITNNTHGYVSYGSADGQTRLIL